LIERRHGKSIDQKFVKFSLVFRLYYLGDQRQLLTAQGFLVKFAAQLINKSAADWQRRPEFVFC